MKILTLLFLFVINTTILANCPKGVFFQNGQEWSLHKDECGKRQRYSKPLKSRKINTYLLDKAMTEDFEYLKLRTYFSEDTTPEIVYDREDHVYLLIYKELKRRKAKKEFKRLYYDNR